MSCVSPNTIRIKGTPQSVPCGKCGHCLARRRSEWITRLTHEYEYSLNGFFITLTYNNANLPFTPDGIPTLDFRDTQLFLKKLRKAQKKGCVVRSDRQKYFDTKNLVLASQTIKYYLVGEYGTIADRPHYHFLMFNVNPELPIQQLWNKGHIHSEPINGGAIGYCASYSISARDDLSKELGRVPSQSRISKGIGATYLKYNRRTIRNREKPFVTVDGHKRILPRYYKTEARENGESISVYNKESALDRVILERLSEENQRQLVKEYWQLCDKLKQQGFQDPDQEIQRRINDREYKIFHDRKLKSIL